LYANLRFFTICVLGSIAGITADMTAGDYRPIKSLRPQPFDGGTGVVV
jgi:hypothetical protein